MPQARSRVGAAAATLLFALAALPPAQAGSADTLQQLWQVLGACARAAGVPDAAASSEVTVLFSLRRDGTLLGQPRITHSHLTGRPDDQRAFISAALTGIASCLPVQVTPELGGAIAGRPLRLRIISRRPERAS